MLHFSDGADGKTGLRTHENHEHGLGTIVGKVASGWASGIGQMGWAWAQGMEMELELDLGKGSFILLALSGFRTGRKLEGK